MINQLKPLNILFSFGAIATLILGYSTPSLAQYTLPGDDPNYQSNEKDSLYGDGITGINPMELIHRARFSNGRNTEEFNQDSVVKIRNSASEFKLQQQQQILEQYNNQEQPELKIEPVVE